MNTTHVSAPDRRAPLSPRHLARFVAGLAATALALAVGCGPTSTGKEAETGEAVGPPQNIVCPEGHALEGGTCVKKPPAAKCAEGQIEKDGQCVPVARTCPPGTHSSVDGKTCVADETPDMRKKEAPKSP